MDPKPAPPKLNLPEAADLLVGYFDCTEEHARDLIERAIFGRSVQDVTTAYADGTEMPTDITAWREIDWDSGFVTLEASYSGSPPTYQPIVPLLNRDELAKSFGIDLGRDSTAQKTLGGRPVQHEWDAFWVEVCRLVHEDDLPVTQSELVDTMLDWFMDRGNERVDRRTVEKKISMLFHALRRS